MAAKKDLVKWCKGKEGVEHTLKPTYVPQRRLNTLAVCGERGGKYRCVHVVQCSVCKRILKYEWQMTRSDCPLASEGAS